MSRSKDRALKAAKEARGGGPFLPLPLAVLRCQALANLSPYAAKLLLDMASQWQLGRNGDASAAFEHVMRSRGWRSKRYLAQGIKGVAEIWATCPDAARLLASMQPVRTGLASD